MPSRGGCPGSTSIEWRFDFVSGDVPFNCQPERPAFAMQCNVISFFRKADRRRDTLAPQRSSSSGSIDLSVQMPNQTRSPLPGCRRRASASPSANQSDARSTVVRVGTFAESNRPYDRHRLGYRMPGIGGDAEERLQNATVGLMGMGGIGSNLAVQLGAAGIGRLVITDGERFEASNLARQTL
jgi:ThiF family